MKSWIVGMSLLSGVAVGPIAHAFVDSKVGISGKIHSLRGDKVLLKSGRRTYLVNRKAFKNPDQLRPETEQMAWLTLDELKALKEYSP